MCSADIPARQTGGRPSQLTNTQRHPQTPGWPTIRLDTLPAGWPTVQFIAVPPPPTNNPRPPYTNNTYYVENGLWV